MVADVDVLEIINQKEKERKVQALEVMVKKADLLVATGQGAGAEAMVIIEGPSAGDHHRVTKNMATEKIHVDVEDRQDVSSVETSEAEEAVADHVHKMDKRNRVGKKDNVDHHDHVIADVDPLVLAVKTRSLNLLTQRLKIPLELLSLKRVSLCRIQLLKVQLRSSHAVMHNYIINIC